MQLLPPILDIVDSLITALQPILDVIISLVLQLADILVPILEIILMPLMTQIQMFAEILNIIAPLEVLQAILVPAIKVLSVVLEPVLNVVQSIVEFIQKIFEWIGAILQIYLNAKSNLLDCNNGSCCSYYTLKI